MLMKCMKFMLLTFALIFSVGANASVVDSLFHQANDPVAGNPKGNVTVVEFFDYQCSHCVNMTSVMDAILKANKNVRVVFKEYPIRGPESELAARAALAANKQGKYYSFNHAVMTSSMALNENNLLDIAKSQGLNMTKFKADMNSKTVKNEIQANYAIASQLNINGTPAFYVGKTNATDASRLNFILGEMSQSELQDAINKASA